MKINILDTYKHYTHMISLNESDRETYFRNNMFKPFDKMFQMLGMPQDINMLGYLPIIGYDNLSKDMLNKLKANRAWTDAEGALKSAKKNLDGFSIYIPEQVSVGIFLGNLETLLSSRGYSGIGSIPGFIQIVIAPNEYNLPRLFPCIVHEFHHNVVFNNATWNFMNVSLSQYLAVEGLAECFAESLYGSKLLGPWVSEITGEQLESTRNIIGNNIDVSGFMEARKYMYGDHDMVEGGEATEIPYCGGYAVGYHAVKAFMEKESASIAQATKAFIDGKDIVKDSGYFD